MFYDIIPIRISDEIFVSAIHCKRSRKNKREEQHMLRAALGLFIIALIAAFFGFGGIAGIAAGGAQLFFFGFLILAVLGLIVGVFRGL